MSPDSGSGYEWSRLECQLREYCRRTEQLENANRRLKWSLGAGVGLLLVFFAAGARMAQVPDVVEARQFLLRDIAGNVRLKIGIEPLIGDPQITIFDKRNIGCASFTATGVQFSNKDEGPATLRAFIGVSQKLACMKLIDENGKRQCFLGFDKAGIQLNFHDGTNQRLGLSIDEVTGYAPDLSLWDSKGKQRAALSTLGPDQQPNLYFRHADEEEGMRLGISQDSAPGLAVLNHGTTKALQILFRLDSDNVPLLQMNAKDGHEILKLPQK
jgi:hypothetical protein